MSPETCIFVSVFHRILDFTRGWISIRPLFFLMRLLLFFDYVDFFKSNYCFNVITAYFRNVLSKPAFF